MKKLLAIFALVSALCSLSYADDYDFEFGPRLGYISYSDDLLDSGMMWGLQGAFYLNPDNRIRLSYDFYTGDKTSEVHELDYSTTWTQNGTTYTNYYFIDWMFEYEIETNPLFLEYNYLFILDDFNFYIGAGLGISFNDMSTSSSFHQQNAVSQSIAAELNSTINVKSDMDDSFMYGFTAGGAYKIFDNLTVEVSAAYILNEADASVSIRGPDYAADQDMTVDMDSFSLVSSLNYLF